MLNDDILLIKNELKNLSIEIIFSSKKEREIIIGRILYYQSMLEQLKEIRKEILS